MRDCITRSFPMGRASVKVTGLAKKLGQLGAVNRDLQSKYWANLNLLGQPCNFYADGARAPVIRCSKAQWSAVWPWWFTESSGAPPSSRTSTVRTCQIEQVCL